MLIGFRRYYIIYTIPIFQFYFFTMQTYKTRQLCNQTYICCMIKYPSHLLMNRSGSVHSFFGPSQAILVFGPSFCGLPSLSYLCRPIFAIFCQIFCSQAIFEIQKVTDFPKFGLVWITGQGLTQPYLGKSEKLCKGSLLVFDLNLVFDDDNKCKHAQ